MGRGNFKEAHEKSLVYSFSLILEKQVQSYLQQTLPGEAAQLTIPLVIPSYPVVI